MRVIFLITVRHARYFLRAVRYARYFLKNCTVVVVPYFIQSYLYAVFFQDYLSSSAEIRITQVTNVITLGYPGLSLNLRITGDVTLVSNNPERPEVVGLRGMLT